MPLLIPQYQQQTTIDQAGAPRAGVPQFAPDGMGRALSDLATNLSSFLGEQHKAQQAADLNDRIGKATGELQDLELSFKLDQDFNTAPARFDAGAVAIRDKYLENVQDPAVKSAFTKQFQQMTLAKGFNVKVDAQGKARGYYIGSLDQQLDVLAAAAGNARNPAERALAEQQARLAIETTQTSGYIDPVEAGKRERAFLGKIDQAIVIRDLAMDPVMVVAKLGIDPTYAPNVDEVLRERFIDQAIRRSTADEAARAREADKWAKERGDEVMRDVWGRHADGTLTREYLDQNRAFMAPAEYRQALEAMTKPAKVPIEDHMEAFADLQVLLNRNPADAKRAALQYYKDGKIKDSTLQSVMNTAHARQMEYRDIGRTEGPKSVYERSKQFLQTSLDPGPLSADPAPRVRFGVALKEYEDYAASGKRSDKELEDKASALVNKYHIIDMNELVRKTGLGSRDSAPSVLDRLTAKARDLAARLAAKTISQSDFDKQMDDLNRARLAAEKVGNGGK